MFDNIPYGTVIVYDMARDVPGGELFYGKYIIKIVGKEFGFNVGEIIKVLRQPSNRTVLLDSDHTKEVGDKIFYLPSEKRFEPNKILMDML